MMKITDFYIGQKVICVEDKNENDNDGVPYGIEKGKIYTIEGFDKCKKCGLELILIEGVDTGSKKECFCSHDAVLPTNAFYYKRFIDPNKFITNDFIEPKKEIKPKKKRDFTKHKDFLNNLRDKITNIFEPIINYYKE